MKNILIISCDLIFAHGAQVILENGGFGVDILPSLSPEASAYDAILTDDPRLKHTNYLCPVIVTDYQNADCELFLLRPFFDDELLDICSLACKQTKSNTSDKFMLDHKRKRVSFGNNSLPLTAREFSLMKLLSESQNQAVSREDIINTVFGGTATGNADAVYVNYLRKKLSSLSGKNPIISVRGVGYQFKDQF